MVPFPAMTNIQLYYTHSGQTEREREFQKNIYRWRICMCVSVCERVYVCKREYVCEKERVCECVCVKR